MYRVRVNTIIDDTYEGTVFAYDPLTHTVALCHTPANAAVANNGTTPAQLADYRILKISFIKDVSVLSGPAKNSSGSGGQVTGGPFANVEPKIGLVTINNVLDREKTTVKQEAERSVTRGVGVTKEAQEIFDGLSRM